MGIYPLKSPTTYSEQEILNHGTDGDIKTSPLSIRGALHWVEGHGWVKAPLKEMFPYEQYDWTSGNLDYIGINDDISAADGDTDWIIFKIEWTNGKIVKQRMRKTSWADRNLGW